MVEMKTAVAKAIDFAKDSLGPDRTASIRLEEVESGIVSKKAVWLITLSYPLINEGPLAALGATILTLGADLRREYKQFAVVKEDGEVLSMKIRLFATPLMK